jgi:hypothetical protein
MRIVAKGLAKSKRAQITRAVAREMRGCRAVAPAGRHLDDEVSGFAGKERCGVNADAHPMPQTRPEVAADRWLVPVALQDLRAPRRPAVRLPTEHAGGWTKAGPHIPGDCP